MWKLVIEDDEGKRTVVPLTRDGYTVGRKEGNTIRLTERNVSREHARIRRSNGAVPGHYALEDLHSYNGVFVNGIRVSADHELQHGDLIQIGDYRMILQDEGVTEEAPPPVMTEDDSKSTLPQGVVNRGSLLLERPNRFVMLAGPTPGMEYPLEQERMTIGRAEDCGISINHNSVSRVHCEVHALGEGRFEIVDRGSSNGVHVNGRELKRGIVEAGDIIELGDVRFRFVGAGQVFLPGVNDSQQLTAIGDRLADRALKPKGGAVTGYIALGAFAAVLLVLGGWYLVQQRQQQAALNDPDLPQNREAVALATAKKLCADQNDCQSAHDEIMTHISDGSPLRLSPDFKYIETHWADQLLERAAAEPDETKKRSFLRQVEHATSVDEDRRKLASARLRELDAVPTPPHTATGPTTSVTVIELPPPTVPPTGTTPPTVTTTKPPPPTSTTAVKPPPSHSATVKPPAKTPYDQARDLYLNRDLAGARTILEARVFGHQASAEEVKFLREICKEQADKACRSKIDQMYPQ